MHEHNHHNRNTGDFRLIMVEAFGRGVETDFDHNNYLAYPIHQNSAKTQWKLVHFLSRDDVFHDKQYVEILNEVSPRDAIELKVQRMNPGYAVNLRVEDYKGGKQER